MDQIDKYRRVEEDQLQGKGKAKVIPQERRDFRLDRYNNNRSRKEFIGQPGCRVPRPLGSLLSMSMWEGETLKAYSDRY